MIGQEVPEIPDAAAMTPVVSSGGGKKKKGAPRSSIYLFVRGSHAHLAKRWIYRVINLRAGVARTPRSTDDDGFTRARYNTFWLGESAGQLSSFAPMKLSGKAITIVPKKRVKKESRIIRILQRSQLYYL